MFNCENLKSIIAAGDIIAYPTEAVYGLGCDPFSTAAIEKILDCKQRPAHKGMILLVSNWQQLDDIMGPLPAAEQQMQQLRETWPGPFTWIIPANERVPKLIKGEHHSVAVRMTAHPIAREICECLGHAVVSTSANLSGQEPIRDAASIRATFGDKIDLIIDGEVGDLPNPTPIRDLLTGKWIRK